ncbi:hypothetical protein [Actinomyces culturomici]|uniref:hypothetical protein n=1 Tax=Actinomyces culturomici TaxID=1926276 RepID=UPI00135752B3|nr:hypothetical protein [Actinomyces culturomici]
MSSTVDDRPLVSRGWIASFGLMCLGINIAWAAPAQLLIANQILEWNSGEKEALLASIMTVGGVLGLIASPLWGFMSDRTKSRLGPRAPRIILSALTCEAALAAMAFSSGFVMLFALW